MASDERTGGPAGTGDYVVQDGECCESIAHQHGFFWETVWRDENNAELRREREDPFVLLTGDRLFVPERREGSEDGATESCHTFRRKGVPSKFRIQILSGGEPRADEPFVAVVDDKRHEGRTDQEGWVEFSIPPDARSGELIIGEEGEDQDRIDLELGGLDPITEITGVQMRLANMGFDGGAPGVLDEETAAAIADFQESEELEATGELDDDTRDRLLEVHGS